MAYHPRNYRYGRDPEEDAVVRILFGGDGFRAFCTLCIEPAGPLRGMFAIAAADRSLHRCRQTAQPMRAARLVRPETCPCARCTHS